MKLASYKYQRDGRLMVVSRDLKRCISANNVDADFPTTLQGCLDDWGHAKPKLEVLSQMLDEGLLENAQDFDILQCESPLPRAYQIVDGSAYLNHVELVRKARGAEMPPEFLHDPLMYQAVSDIILAPHEDVPVGSEDYGIDFEAEVAVIVDDVPMGVSADDARAHIKLVMLMNDVSLRALIPNELGKGFGFLQSKPPSAFTPVAVSPDELGDAWDGGKLHLPLLSTYNGRELGHPNAGDDMQFDFGQLIAHAAKTRPLAAGAIVGSGTISNYDRNKGVSCFAETRMIEKIESGEFKTPFMKYGDVIRIEMKGADGASIFGAIEQKIVPYAYEGKAGHKKAS